MNGLSNEAGNGTIRSKTLGVASWVPALVSMLMMVLYLQRAECAGPDLDAAYIAVAWGVILGVTLSNAVSKMRRGLRRRVKRGLSD